ncbi:MAG: hypothetical protein GC131_02635 [Alphaproteobacteria bacterium]|nr:hypothetical protein [Alphaproteobacteria bacterium]
MASQNKNDIKERASTDGARASDFVSRNYRVNGRRTSIRLERIFWNAFEDAARRERHDVAELCSNIDRRRDKGISLTAAVRLFVINYYRGASAAPASAHGFAEQGQSPLEGEQGSLIEKALGVLD